MFALPKIVETRVFARLPEALKTADRNNAWVLGQPLGAPVGSLLEGPCFDRDGNFWCVDIQNGRIFKLTRDGQFQVIAEYDGWPNGLKFHKDGRGFIADYKHGIMTLDPVNGRVTPWVVRTQVEPFKGVNDLFFASNGDLYFTDQGLTGLHDSTGRLFRITPQGRLTCLLDNIPSPNGLVMNQDESQMFVAVTRGNCVWRVPFLRDGSVAKVGLYIQLSGGGGPDGMALDENDGLVVAHVGMGAVWVFDAIGEPVARIRSAAGHFITNVAFGGPDRKTLYITESASGSILTAQLDVAGQTMYSNR